MLYEEKWFSIFACKKQNQIHLSFILPFVRLPSPPHLLRCHRCDRKSDHAPDTGALIVETTPATGFEERLLRVEGLLEMTRVDKQVREHREAIPVERSILLSTFIDKYVERTRHVVYVFVVQSICR